MSTKRFIRFMAVVFPCSLLFSNCSDDEIAATLDEVESYEEQTDMDTTTTYVVERPKMVSVVGATITSEDTIGAFIKGRIVTLSDYEISAYLVTKDLYFKTMYDDKFANANPSSCEFNNDYQGIIAEGEIDSLRPVETVSWFDAVYFCNRLSLIHGYEPVYTITNITRDKAKSIISANVSQNLNKNGYRLPTECEWEFAARGGDMNKEDWNYYYAGEPSNNPNTAMDDAMDAIGWYNCNAETGVTIGRNPSTMHGTHQVGLKNPNRLGLYDMSGNLFEWCYDWDSNLSTETIVNPEGPSSGEKKILRGGSWLHGWAIYCGVRQRLSSAPENGKDYYGFRLARSMR